MVALYLIKNELKKISKLDTINKVVFDVNYNEKQFILTINEIKVDNIKFKEITNYSEMFLKILKNKINFEEIYKLILSIDFKTKKTNVECYVSIDKELKKIVTEIKL